MKTQTNTAHYRDQSKRDRTPKWGQIARWIYNAKTPEEWIKAFSMLPIKDQFEFLYKYHQPPKENVVKSEGSVTISLVLDGLTKTKEVEGELVDHKALPVDNSDDEPVDNS